MSDDDDDGGDAGHEVSLNFRVGRSGGLLKLGKRKIDR